MPLARQSNSTGHRGILRRRVGTMTDSRAPNRMVRMKRSPRSVWPYGRLATLCAIAAVGARFLGSVLPWAGLSIGIAMFLLGIWLLVGKKKLYAGVAARISARINTGVTG